VAILLLRCGAPFQQIKERFEDVRPLQEYFGRVVVEDQHLQPLTRLKYCGRIPKLQRYRKVEELFFVLLRQEYEWELARLFEDLLLVHDLHVALVHSGLHHHRLDIRSVREPPGVAHLRRLAAGDPWRFPRKAVLLLHWRSLGHGELLTAKSCL